MNIVKLARNTQGQIRLVSHEYTQPFNQHEQFIEALLLLNGFEQFRYQQNCRVGKTLSRKALLKLAWQQWGEIGVNWLLIAEQLEEKLTDRAKSLAIAHAICVKHQAVFQQKQPGLAAAYPITALARDVGLYSEPTIRRFIQYNKLYLAYDGMLLDAEDLAPRSNRSLVLYYIGLLDIDIGLTPKSTIAKLLYDNFGLVMGTSNLRFVDHYI